MDFDYSQAYITLADGTEVQVLVEGVTDMEETAGLMWEEISESSNLLADGNLKPVKAVETAKK